jgi:hypothetical protein
VSDEREKKAPEPEIQRQDEGDDVEAHKVHEKVHEAADAAAMEEGPDVEGHRFNPKAPPKATP